MAKEQDIKKLKEFKRRLSQKIPVSNMLLFGSRAKGKTHEFSDYDLLIVSEKFRGIGSRYRSLGFYKYWNWNKPFDFLCYTPEEFNKLKKQVTIVREAVKEGIEI